MLLPALLSTLYGEGHSHCSSESTVVWLTEGMTLTGTGKKKSPHTVYRLRTWFISAALQVIYTGITNQSTAAHGHRLPDLLTESKPLSKLFRGKDRGHKMYQQCLFKINTAVTVTPFPPSSVSHMYHFLSLIHI